MQHAVINKETFLIISQLYNFETHGINEIRSNVFLFLVHTSKGFVCQLLNPLP